MASETLPIVAAIPNYNMADSLNRLLGQVVEQGYDDVFVLDDASTDHSSGVAAAFDSEVHFVSDEKNVGPGANRNRILDALGQEAIIHFMDADVRLLTEDALAAIRATFGEHSDAGAIGGLIRLPDGEPWMFNYGPRYSLYSNIAGWAQSIVHDPAGPKPVKKLVDRLSGWRHRGFPDISKEPEARQVFWVGEANFCILSRVFREVGGFDPALRYHETQDLGFKLHELGYETWFDPSFAVEHPVIELGDPHRQELHNKAHKQIIRKYGWHLK